MSLSGCKETKLFDNCNGNDIIMYFLGELIYKYKYIYICRTMLNGFLTLFRLQAF